MSKVIFLLLLFSLFINANDFFYYQYGKKIYLTPIESEKSIEKRSIKDIHYYITQNGYIVGIKKEIIIKVKTKKTLSNLLTKYSLIFKRKLANNLYLVEVNSTKNTLNISNKLFLDDNVIYAQPNLIKKIINR